MKAKWLVCNLGKDDHVNQLFYGVQECGREAAVVSMKEFVEMIEEPSDESACVVTCGSIWMNTEVRRKRPNWAGNWHDESLYNCRRYYAYWGEHITQRKYLMLPFSEVCRQQEWLYETIGLGGELFLRPDSGAKEFNGEVISRDRFAAWSKYTAEWVQKDLLCVASQPVKLDKEYRLVVRDGRVVTGSMYRMAKHVVSERLDKSDEEMGKVAAFAEQVMAGSPMPLPPIHVIDVAVEPDRMSVMEVGCFCCAGLYECDRRAVAEHVSLAAEEEFSRRQGRESPSPS